MKSIKLASLFLLLLIAGIGCDDNDEFNVVPLANAGPSQTITLPANSITVTGTGSDQDGTVVAYLWSQVAGPEATIIVNPGSPTTSIRGFVQGSYIFQLMVTDEDGATGVDTMAVTVNSSTSQTLTLQPGNNPNERLLVSIGGVDQSSTGNIEWVLDAWTVGGSAYLGREAVKFDLSSIPASATILGANLFLYSNSPPENGNLTDANFGSDNSLVLQRITANWTPAGANWNNQPATTTVNQVVVPHTAQSVLDINVDVTALVSTMVNSSSNYGFLVKLQNEVAYTSRAFVSSYHTVKTAKRPKLVINYRL